MQFTLPKFRQSLTEFAACRLGVCVMCKYVALSLLLSLPTATPPCNGTACVLALLPNGIVHISLD